AESVERELVPSDLRLEHGGVVLALPAADDLAVALGCEHVDAEGEARIGRVGLHVEGLRLHRIAVHHHRAVELLRERRLLVAAEIGAPLEREAFLAQDVERLGVGDAREGLLHALERYQIATEGAQLGLAALAHGAGVKMGASKARKPWPSRYSRQARITSLRTRSSACCRDDRSQRWRWSSRNAGPCSFGVIG